MNVLKHNLPKKSVFEIEFVNDANDGEAGWFIYLNDGWSFDPMANDGSTFIALDNKQDAAELVAYEI